MKMANNIDIKQRIESQIKKEDIMVIKIEPEQRYMDQDKNQSNQINVTYTCNNSSIIEKIKEEFEKEINKEFEANQDHITREKEESEKLILELESNQNSTDSKYTQFKSRKHDISEKMLKLVKKCDIIYSKQRISNQDIDKLLKVSEDFIDSYYSNIDKYKVEEDFDWFTELSRLAYIKKERIELIIKLSTRLNMFVCLADSKYFKEVVKFLDLDLIANMDNLDWKLLHGRMLDIYSCED
ncbi:hypothetical protein CONCODRAFT_8835 [Conidiobolus coronatus NRRL 28638]|uniref:Uncharacterized protein n=1 Tax=Conidiobolus coronatus (strain ATCC 28846 / CBS 209.66 / NRRL 28638) TaxID=796925 RepID=A0A137P1E0_CONC2|nr:hypothetical protein CONCODRAFT_8835 [Conidiobolus coronatus NRRL 28638]|eukprot:KXN68822.1 hypothetical protein CONCODRAFT_8835 [Conidiobolus coronatus NRRL 28638]